MSIELQASARDLFRAAYENRYTWDAGFPGFEADFSLNLNGQTYTGTASIRPDLSVAIETEDDKAREWLTNQMRDVVTHRKRSNFEQAHGKHEFSFDGQPDETGALPILVGGDAMGSHYKIRDKQVVQVNRVMGPVGFSINHLEKIDTGSGYISSAYNAVFRNPKTEEITRQSKFEETYDQFEGYWVLTHQVVHSRLSDRTEVVEISFSNLRRIAA